MKMSDFLGFRLDVFDAGTAAAGSGEASAADSASGESTAVSNESSVVATENNQAVNTDSQTDYSAEFDREIKKGGKYYEAFKNRADAVAARATSKAKSLQETIDSNKKVIDLVAKMTGVQATDTEGLLNALKDNNAFYEKIAMQKGISVQEAKLTVENEMLKENERSRLEAAASEANRQKLQRAAAEKMQGWMAEAEKVKEKYAQYGLTFDLQKELANDDFRRLVQSMKSVEAAYRTIHFDEISNAMVDSAVQRTKAEAVNALKTNKGRPVEGGISTSKSIKTVDGLKNLTAKDREKIAKDMLKGRNPFR